MPASSRLARASARSRRSATAGTRSSSITRRAPSSSRSITTRPSTGSRRSISSGRGLDRRRGPGGAARDVRRVHRQPRHRAHHRRGDLPARRRDAAPAGRRRDPGRARQAQMLRFLPLPDRDGGRDRGLLGEAEPSHGPDPHRLRPEHGAEGQRHGGRLVGPGHAAGHPGQPADRRGAVARRRAAAALRRRPCVGIRAGELQPDDPGAVAARLHRSARRGFPRHGRDGILRVAPQGTPAPGAGRDPRAAHRADAARDRRAGGAGAATARDVLRRDGLGGDPAGPAPQGDLPDRRAPHGAGSAARQHRSISGWIGPSSSA